MGASLTATGVNFVVFSAHATAIELCLFDPSGRDELARYAFPGREGDLWHLHLEGLEEGALYGLRAYGPWAPGEGHRFNPHKLLLDPWAQEVQGAFRQGDALLGYDPGHPDRDLSFSETDSAPFMPKARVSRLQAYQGAPGPDHAPQDRVIYEAHLRGISMLHPDVPEAERGICAGLASDAMIAHLSALGVTTIELLPVQLLLSERFLSERGLGNYWGYNTAGFFTPEPRYTGPGGMRAFQQMVDRLHRAGIEVILDMVFNHSAEGDELGPTLSFRGLDNASWYRLQEDRRFYENDSGTGNVLDLNQPIAIRLVLDALRHWVEVGGVDGFRFDLAPSLGRGPSGAFDPRAALFSAILQDPVLQKAQLIAEPWDLGQEGYLPGAFPARFSEWNDRYRDALRRFWRGDRGAAGDLASALLGSAEIFERKGAGAQASVNFVTSHDGFTLADLSRYAQRHNEANGEENRDGHSGNFSDNLGVEGESSDPAILAARALRSRNLLATLMLSQGVPMLLAGDESGNSQAGNNNAYAQDNPTGWLDWSRAGHSLTDFTARLIALRRATPLLRQRDYLHGEPTPSGKADILWRGAAGEVMQPHDWALCDCLCLELNSRERAGPAPGVYAVFNRGAARRLILPPGSWQLVLDTTRPQLTAEEPPEFVAAQSVLLFSTRVPAR